MCISWGFLQVGIFLPSEDSPRARVSQGWAGLGWAGLGEGGGGGIKQTFKLIKQQQRSDWLRTIKDMSRLQSQYIHKILEQGDICGVYLWWWVRSSSVMLFRLRPGWAVFYSSMLMRCTNKDLLPCNEKLFTNNLPQKHIMLHDNQDLCMNKSFSLHIENILLIVDEQYFDW